ncbi:hypothetical protein B0H19DRAFT_1239461 [Mycena capillaripes]|nr:hypothetical protein B0H19DRAFT_1239461 [Mycena capillaripes]
MPRLQYLPAFITNYRIGYSPQRPYPWRWTTPLALFILFTSAALLTCLNVPLSAYEIVQEFTYFPNATLAALPMSNMIPSFLHAPTATFAPVNLNIGQTFRLNNSIFTYTISSAFDAVDNGKPVFSFPYYNNLFSSSCDVTNITATVGRNLGGGAAVYPYYVYGISGFVTCMSPTLFQMTWGLPIHGGLDLFPLLDYFGADLQQALWYGVLGVNDELYGDAAVTVTARPCCNCSGTMSDADLKLESANLLQPPCSTQPARFIALTGSVQNTTATISPWGCPYTWTGPNTTDLFAGLNPVCRQDYIGSHDLSALETTFQNLLQVSYHLVRRDLGVILGNQIDNSPEMFNRRISPVEVPQSLLGDSQTPFNTITASTANRMRTALSNDTLMAHLIRDPHRNRNYGLRLRVLRSPYPSRKALAQTIYGDGSIRAFNAHHHQSLLAVRAAFCCAVYLAHPHTLNVVKYQTFKTPWRFGLIPVFVDIAAVGTIALGTFLISYRPSCDPEDDRPLGTLYGYGYGRWYHNYGRNVYGRNMWTIFSVVARAFVRSPDNDFNTPVLRERFHLPLHEAKRSFEEIEETEFSSLAVAYKVPIDMDDHPGWRIAFGILVNLTVHHLLKIWCHLFLKLDVKSSNLCSCFSARKVWFGSGHFALNTKLEPHSRFALAHVRFHPVQPRKGADQRSDPFRALLLANRRTPAMYWCRPYCDMYVPFPSPSLHFASPRLYAVLSSHSRAACDSPDADV